MNSSLTCPLVPSEKLLEEEPMDESIPKVCVPWGVPLSEEIQDGEETFWWICRRKLGWVDPPVPLSSVLSPRSVTPDVLCHLATRVSCRGSSHQPHSRGAQPSNSSSLEFIQHVHPPEACVVLLSRSAVVCGACLHVTRLAHCPQRGNVCFLNGSKPWKPTDVFIWFCVWVLITFPC